MSLDDMLFRCEIESVPASAEEIGNLLEMARRRLQDARSREISNETRFEQAYHVILTCATAVLRGDGLRVSGGQPKHIRVIESMRFTLKKTKKEIRFLHKIRSKRHDDMYEGSVSITNVELRETIQVAEHLFDEALQWLKAHHQDLMTDA